MRLKVRWNVLRLRNTAEQALCLSSTSKVFLLECEFFREGEFDRESPKVYKYLGGFLQSEKRLTKWINDLLTKD